MAGIIAVYGLVVSVLIAGDSTLLPYLPPPCSLAHKSCSVTVSPDTPYPLYNGFIHLAAGLCCGLTGLAAGYAIGIVGDSVSLCSISRWPTPSVDAADTHIEHVTSLGCSCLRVRIKSLRHNGPHPHLLRSSGVIRVSLPYSPVSMTGTDLPDAPFRLIVALIMHTTTKETAAFCTM